MEIKNFYVTLGEGTKDEAHLQLIMPEKQIQIMKDLNLPMTTDKEIMETINKSKEIYRDKYPDEANEFYSK